ncbi:hypothetical protein T06_14573 [Trichinella sp. T6]|nr:hypothetical protein T06_14573 [Trichinella sp. T6]
MDNGNEMSKKQDCQNSLSNKRIITARNTSLARFSFSLVRSRLSFGSNAGTALLSVHVSSEILSYSYFHWMKTKTFQSNNFGEEHFFTKFQFQPNPARSVDVCKNFFCSK